MDQSVSGEVHVDHRWRSTNCPEAQPGEDEGGRVEEVEGAEGGGAEGEGGMEEVGVLDDAVRVLAWEKGCQTNCSSNGGASRGLFQRDSGQRKMIE